MILDNPLRPFRMNSMVSMMHSQINRAISNAITERIIPEIQNIASSMSSSGNRDTEASVSPNSQENRECSSGFKSKFAKKDSQSACDLRDIAGRSHYRGTYIESVSAWKHIRSE